MSDTQPGPVPDGEGGQEDGRNRRGRATLIKRKFPKRKTVEASIRVC